MSTDKTLTAAHLPILLKGSIIHQLLYVIEFLWERKVFSINYQLINRAERQRIKLHVEVCNGMRLTSQFSYAQKKQTNTKTPHTYQH